MQSGMGLPNLEALEAMVTRQAAAMAYSNDSLMTLVSLHLLALIRSPKAATAPCQVAAGRRRRWTDPLNGQPSDKRMRRCPYARTRIARAAGRSNAKDARKLEMDATAPKIGGPIRLDA